MTRLDNLTFTTNGWNSSAYTCGLETDDEDVIKFLANKSGLTDYSKSNKGRRIAFPLVSEVKVPKIKDVIFNPPATIVLWKDGTKTVVKIDARYDKNYQYDPEKGLAMCIAKKVLGNKGNYYELFKKYIWDKDDTFLNSYKDYPAIVPKDIYTTN